MTIKCDFDIQLVHMFYATIHYGTDQARTLSFMCRGEFFSVPRRAFYNALGYDDTGLSGIGGIRPHGRTYAMEKEMLTPLYIQGRGIIGDSKDMPPLYDIMHRAFCNVLLPKVGNQDEIHGYLVDLLVAMHTELVWEVRKPGEALSFSPDLTMHEAKQLQKKKHALPRIPPNHPEDVFATSSDSDFELDAGAKPSWVTKLTDKVCKTFCLQAHLQKKLYTSHVNEKLATHRHIQIMRAL
ncbi:dna replication licensing factor mcm4 [Hordeum vulgare]|nr:dna replication licensing factor mcm4 [Hordeum vulgare]